MKKGLTYEGAVVLADAVRSRQISAGEVVDASLERITNANEHIIAFTEVTATAARRRAESIDATIARGEDPGPLAGVPFAVKNLFDIAAVPTLAGSKVRAKSPPAQQDATAISTLQRAGAVLVGALNMNEFAFGITGENTHYGTTRNPHDLNRVSGGSSGGSAAAVAAGLVPLALGSDTNGSIRVPAAFCGVFGFKPTYGRLSRAGVVLFADSFDHIGPIARSVDDLSFIFDLLQGYDLQDSICSDRPLEPTFPLLPLGSSGLKFAVADDYFRRLASAEALEALSRVAKALNATATVRIPEPARACAAASVITRSEGGNYHLPNLQTQASDYDPLTRSRFLSGALIPAAWVNFAQRFRWWFRERMREIFRSVDVILTPTTPCPAIRVGQETIILEGKEVPARANIAVFTQPFSFVGLPAISVPVHLPNQLPFGVQLIAAPYEEGKLLRAAHQLQLEGVAIAPVARRFAH